MSKHLRRSLALVTMPATALLAMAVSAPAASASRTPQAEAAASAKRLTCGASMTNAHPADYTSTGVNVRTVAYAHIKTVAHYRTVTHPKYATANADGRRSVWYYISGATPGYRVVVDVYVSKGAKKGSCSTSFTPHS
jgi:hypothetical protein